MNDDKNEAIVPQIQISNIYYYGILIFIFLWTLIGILAFIQSIMCFGYKGNNYDKTIGLIISAIFGPFYWIFYKVNTDYCKFRK